MNTLYYIVQKEFIQIFRNKAMLPLMTIVPIVQLIVLSYAADNEVRQVNLAVFDQDKSTYSNRLMEKIRISNRFVLIDVPPDFNLAENLIQEGEADVVLTIPPQFESDVIRLGGSKIQLLVNAINGQQATVGASYLSAIIAGLSADIAIELLSMGGKRAIVGSTIHVLPLFWYNQDLNYKYFMVPGIMGELVTILVILLTAMNVVREREVGTIEQINVTPIKKWQFILGKMIPFLIFGIALLTLGLTVGKLIFDVPIRGNLVVVFAYCVVNISAVLGLGLFISNLSNTQQQAMFTTFFFVIIFVLMSGLFTPIESMPQWAQYLTVPNPIAHFVSVMRAVLLKGSSFYDVIYQFKVTAILAIVFNALAVWSYRKVG